MKNQKNHIDYGIGFFEGINEVIKKCSGATKLLKIETFSSTILRYVLGKSGELVKYIILLYLTNLYDRENHTIVIKKCEKSFKRISLNRCYKNLNLICNIRVNEPCGYRNNYFYNHLGEFLPTLSYYLKTQQTHLTGEEENVYVFPVSKRTTNKIKIVNLEKNKFNKINTKKVMSILKDYDIRLVGALNSINTLTKKIGFATLDQNDILNQIIGGETLLKKGVSADLNLIEKRMEEMKKLNSISKDFLKNISDYLEKEVYNNIPKKNFSVY